MLKKEKNPYMPEVGAKKIKESYGISERNSTQQMKGPKLAANVCKEEMEQRLTRK